MSENPARPERVKRPPGRPAKTPQPTRVPAPAVLFEADGHAIRIWMERDRWRVAVDGASIDRWFSSQVEAWEAGVAEADRRERTAALRATGTDLHSAG